LSNETAEFENLELPWGDGILTYRVGLAVKPDWEGTWDGGTVEVELLEASLVGIGDSEALLCQVSRGHSQ
jgi:hypothetical protein